MNERGVGVKLTWVLGSGQENSSACVCASVRVFRVSLRVPACMYVCVRVCNCVRTSMMRLAQACARTVCTNGVHVGVHVGAHVHVQLHENQQLNLQVCCSSSVDMIVTCKIKGILPDYDDNNQRQRAVDCVCIHTPVGSSSVDMIVQNQGNFA